MYKPKYRGERKATMNTLLHLNDTNKKHRPHFHKIGVIKKNPCNPKRKNPCNPKILYRKTFAAAAGTTGVGVMKIKAFAIQSIAKIKLGSGQVKERLHIQSHFNAFVLKKLVALFYFVVKIKVIR